MKKFIYKVIIISMIISSFLLIINYCADPGNLFSKSYENEIVDMLKFNNVTNISNYDERAFQREFINSLDVKPEIIAIGSSRVGYIDSDFFSDQIFINSGDMAAAMLRIVEVIGQDELKNIDEDTLYFIISTLNQLDADPLRNKILLKILPLKV